MEWHETEEGRKSLPMDLPPSTSLKQPTPDRVADPSTASTTRAFSGVTARQNVEK